MELAIVDLEDGPAAIQPKIDGAGQAEFRIDNDGAANWYLRKLNEKRTAIETLKAQYALMLAELQSDEKSFTNRFGAEFEQYAASKVAGTSKKSHKFFFGTAAFRTVAERFAIADAETALQTAKLVCPTAIRTVEQLESRTLIEYVEAANVDAPSVVNETTGEVSRIWDLPPGVEFIAARESFSVSFAKKSQAEQIVTGAAYAGPEGE